MDAKRLRAEIVAAFDDPVVPDAQQLITPQQGIDRESAEAIRRSLAGKTWQSLTRDFLDESWSSFVYVTPTAYRYYLPALLTAAEEELIETPARADSRLRRLRSNLLHSVVFSLRPSFYALYYQGDDPWLSERQSLLTPAQYRAVCTLLGAVYETRPDMRRLAASALFWGWSRVDDHPAADAARSYYRDLRQYAYPEPAEPEACRVYREIVSAFATTPYPGDDRLCGSDQGDEPAEYAMELRGVRWQSAHPAQLSHCYAALSFLSDDGFRYFLPAFLVASVTGNETGVETSADPVFHLTHGLHDERQAGSIENTIQMMEGSVDAEVLESLRESHARRAPIDWREYTTKRCAGFDRGERKAIVSYLEYWAGQGVSESEIRQALDSYWLPSLD